jgi:hypothetical protein
MTRNGKPTNGAAQRKGERARVAGEVAELCAAEWLRRTGAPWRDEYATRLRLLVQRNQEHAKGKTPSLREQRARRIVEGLRESYAAAVDFVESLTDDEPDGPCSRYLWAWRSKTDIRVTNRARGEWTHQIDSRAAPIVTDAAFPHPPKRGAEDSARTILAKELTRKILIPFGPGGCTPTKLALAYLLTFGIGDVKASLLEEGAEGILESETTSMKQSHKRYKLGARPVTRVGR